MASTLPRVDWKKGSISHLRSVSSFGCKSSLQGNSGQISSGWTSHQLVPEYRKQWKPFIYSFWTLKMPQVLMLTLLAVLWWWWCTVRSRGGVIGWDLRCFGMLFVFQVFMDFDTWPNKLETSLSLIFLFHPFPNNVAEIRRSSSLQNKSAKFYELKVSTSSNLLERMDKYYVHGIWIYMNIFSHIDPRVSSKICVLRQILSIKHSRWVWRMLTGGPSWHLAGSQQLSGQWIGMPISLAGPGGLEDPTLVSTKWLGLKGWWCEGFLSPGGWKQLEAGKWWVWVQMIFLFNWVIFWLPAINLLGLGSTWNCGVMSDVSSVLDLQKSQP